MAGFTSPPKNPVYDNRHASADSHIGPPREKDNTSDD
jgi:hypothetical protein